MKPSVIFMGSKPGSVVALSHLLELGWDIKYVVITKSQNLDWIGGKTLEQFALEKGLNVTTQKQLPKNEKVDIVISYMYRYLVKDDVLDLAKIGAFNFHAGPLPEFGGWAFYNIAILENSTEYGCTCHYMDSGFDTGPLFKVNRFPINAKEETAYSLEQKAQEEMIRLFYEFTNIIESGDELPKIEQDKSNMRYMQQDEFQKLKQIHINDSSEKIDRVARAFWYPPYECAYILNGDKKIEVVPEIVKHELATHLHKNDFNSLNEALQNAKNQNS